jgi:hypothetical protein
MEHSSGCSSKLTKLLQAKKFLVLRRCSERPVTGPYYDRRGSSPRHHIPFQFHSLTYAQVSQEPNICNVTILKPFITVNILDALKLNLSGINLFEVS